MYPDKAFLVPTERQTTCSNDLFAARITPAGGSVLHWLRGEFAQYWRSQKKKQSGDEDEVVSIHLPHTRKTVCATPCFSSTSSA